MRSKPCPGGAGGRRALEAMVANQRSAMWHWRDNLTLRPRGAVVNRKSAATSQSAARQRAACAASRHQYPRLVRRQGAHRAECTAPLIPGPATTRHHRVFADRSRAQAWSMPVGPATGRVEATRRALTAPSTAPASLTRWWCTRSRWSDTRTSCGRMWSARASCAGPLRARSLGHERGPGSTRANGAILRLET